MIHSHRAMYGFRYWVLPAATAGAVLLGGCVRRVHEAPGLPPGSELAVSSSMRMETFEVDDLEVRSYQIPLTGTNQRRYQFVVLKQGIKQNDYMVQLLEDGTWALLEVRSDGITLSKSTWTAEPAYSAARSAVIAALRGGETVRDQS